MCLHALNSLTTRTLIFLIKRSLHSYPRQPVYPPIRQLNPEQFVRKFQKMAVKFVCAKIVEVFRQNLRNISTPRYFRQHYLENVHPDLRRRTFKKGIKARKKTFENYTGSI
jgi:hypothetical protein